MQTSIYTYRKKKVVLFTLPQFYYLNSKIEFDQLVNKLLDIDAVASPSDLTFPCLLKLESGFSVTLTKASPQEFFQSLQAENSQVAEFKKIAKKLSQNLKTSYEKTKV